MITSYSVIVIVQLLTCFFLIPTDEQGELTRRLLLMLCATRHFLLCLHSNFDFLGYYALVREGHMLIVSYMKQRGNKELKQPT